jgi:hypothetical protein
MIVFDAPVYVPFEPRTEQQLALKAELQRKLRGLTVEGDEILWAALAGRLPHGADVENALFYNLGNGAFARCMDNGAAFELDPTPLATGVRYSYWAGAASDELRCWQSTRRLASIAASEMQPTLASIWWALRSVPGSIELSGEAPRMDEPFSLTLEVEGPVRRLTPSLLKCIVDGVVCGLQSQTDQAGAAAVAPLIAGPLGVSADAIAQALTSVEPSALGVRATLVHPRGKGVQWAPDDDRCVAARLLFKTGLRWRLAGSVSAVAAIAA